MHDIAMDLNGFIIGTETRFFGQNRPTDDTSTSNLRFLSIDQILADIAHLIDHVKQQDSRLADARVILTGTMFGGNLATWFRVKYPHHVDGVWSSSSYVEARMNFREYFEQIGNDLYLHGTDLCYRRVWRAFRTMENLIAGGRSTLLDEMFHLCHPLNATEVLEVEQFFESIAEAVSDGIINGGVDYVNDMCRHVTNEDITNDLTAFSEWFLMEHRSSGCFERTFEENVEFLAETSWNAFGVLSGRRQFNYLRCSELGWFMTTDSENQPFGSSISLNYFIETCRRVFEGIGGEWLVEENTARINLMFGGSHPHITNAFFTNGGMDPHRLINVQGYIGDSVEARTLPCEWSDDDDDDGD